MGKWVERRGTRFPVRVWTEEGREVVWCTCDAYECWLDAYAGVKDARETPAYYESDEVYGTGTWCWRHAPDHATPIQVECRCASCREWEKERKKP